MKLILRVLFAFLLVLLGDRLAQAANCASYPYTLTNGQLADANQVMANFNNILNCGNNNLANINQISAYWGGTSGGSGNAQTIVTTPAPALSPGQNYQFIAGFTNTGAATLSVNGVTKSVTKGTASLSGGEIASGSVISVTYDGTQFQMVLGAAGGGSLNATLPLVYNSGTNTISVNAGSASAKGVLQGDNSTVTITAGVIACTTATASQIGCSEPDNVSITASAGVLSCARGSATVQGCIKSDNSTLTINGSTGVMSCTTGSSSQLGCLKPDGTTITSTGGVLSIGVGNGPVLINTLTASSSASLVDTSSLTGTYKSYEIRFINILPATNNARIQCWVSVNGGVSYNTTASVYQQADVTANLAAAAAATPPANASGTGGLCGDGVTISSTSTAPASGIVRLYNPAAAVNHAFDYAFSGVTAVAGQSVNSGLGGGQFNGSTSAINAVQIIMSSGNIASGTVEIWGYP